MSAFTIYVKISHISKENLLLDSLLLVLNPAWHCRECRFTSLRISSPSVSFHYSCQNISQNCVNIVSHSSGIWFRLHALMWNKKRIPNRMKCFWIWLIKLYFKEVSCSQISFYPSSIASFFVALHWRLLLKFTTCQNAQLSLFHSISGKNFRGSINNGKRHLLLCQELASARLQILSPLRQALLLTLV